MTPARKRARTNYDQAASRRDPSTAPVGVTAIRTRPIRVTLDLAPALHEDIKRWTRHTAADLGRDVALADVLRTLTRRLLDDPGLASEIRRELSVPPE